MREDFFRIHGYLRSELWRNETPEIEARAPSKNARLASLRVDRVCFRLAKPQLLVDLTYLVVVQPETLSELPEVRCLLPRIDINCHDTHRVHGRR